MNNDELVRNLSNYVGRRKRYCVFQCEYTGDYYMYKFRNKEFDFMYKVSENWVSQFLTRN